jgi:hypothetical protein
MAGPVNLNNMTTSSAPNAFGALLWFRGTDNKLWRMPVNAPAKVTNPLAPTTSSGNARQSRGQSLSGSAAAIVTR